MEPMQGSKQHRRRTTKPNEIRNWAHSSAGWSVRPITVRSAVQARVGPLWSTPEPLKLRHDTLSATRLQHPLLQRHCVRAVKEMDSKSIGLCSQVVESPRCRLSHAASRTRKATQHKDLVCTNWRGHIVQWYHTRVACGRPCVLLVCVDSASGRTAQSKSINHKNTHRGARTHDHKVKSLALCRLS